MPLVISLDVAELAATRFAASPLSETIRALHLLAKPDPPAVNLPWLRWARARLDEHPLRVPRLWPLVVTGLPHYPEFLVPAPAGQWPAFADELSRLAATPAPAVRASLRRVFADGRWPPSARELFERPEFGEITAELADCHARLIAPHWERIRAVLDADIAYRTAQLARGGRAGLWLAWRRRPRSRPVGRRSGRPTGGCGGPIRSAAWATARSCPRCHCWPSR